MPRKQRFKPSRKPKPVVTVPPDGNNIGETNPQPAQHAQHAQHTQHNEMPRAPDVDMPPASADVRSGPQAEEAEAR